MAARRADALATAREGEGSASVKAIVASGGGGIVRNEANVGFTVTLDVLPERALA